MTRKTIADYLVLPYTIEVTPDEDGFVARVKELSGCMTQADTWDEIWPMIADAKRLWLESVLAHGNAVPEPLGVFG